MNISNLTEGQIFKNYQELCSELGIKPKKGNGKKYQEKEIERYIKYEKADAKGRKLVVKEIYEVAKVKSDNRGKSSGSRGNNNEYQNYIELLLLNVLARANNNKVIYTQNNLLLNMRMINKNYIDCRKSKVNLSKFKSIDTEIVKDFYAKSGDSLRSIIKRSLRGLDDRRCIDYRNVYVVFREGEDHGDIATPLEVEFILECQEEVLEDMGFAKLPAVFATGKVDEFYSRVDNKVRNSNEFDIIVHYKAYEIILNRKGIQKNKAKLSDLLLTDEEESSTHTMLNNKVMTNFTRGFEDRHQKSIAKDNVAFGKRVHSSCRSKENYVSDSVELLNILIDKDAQLIGEQVNKFKIVPDATKGEISFEEALEIEQLT